MDKAPSFRYRRIGMELRRIRKERDLTVSAASRLLDRSAASLSGIENGDAIRARDLEHILYKYGVEDATYEPSADPGMDCLPMLRMF